MKNQKSALNEDLDDKMLYTIDPEEAYLVDKVTGADIDQNIIRSIKDDISQQIERSIQEKLVKTLNLHLSMKD